MTESDPGDFEPETQMDPLFPELGQPGNPEPGESESLMAARDRITESNQARRDERSRILSAARQAAVTFTRPGLGNGPGHGSEVKVVPLEVLEELLGPEDPQ